MKAGHVVVSDVKLLAVGNSAWASVVFQSENEISELIRALTFLRDNASDPNAHFHLQHYGLGKNNGVEDIEIMFHGPAANKGNLTAERDTFAITARDLLRSNE